MPAFFISGTMIQFATDLMIIHSPPRKTGLVATSDDKGIDWSREGNIVVPVNLCDTAGTEVFHADITMSVKQAKNLFVLAG